MAARAAMGPQPRDALSVYVEDMVGSLNRRLCRPARWATLKPLRSRKTEAGSVRNMITARSPEAWGGLPSRRL